MVDKKRINSKAKGSEYELKMSKVLGRWWSEEFHRTPASGGLHWAEDMRVAGDIVTPPTSIYPWVTEMKKRESWDFDNLIKGTGEIEGYWEQVMQDGVRVNLRPLLIFAKNFSPNYMMLWEKDWTDIKNVKGWSDNIAGLNYFVVHKPGIANRVIFILDKFITLVSKEDVIDAFNLDRR